MPTDPKQCHQYAWKCAEMADKVTNPAHKRVLTELAHTWLGIAVEVERAYALLDACPEPKPIGVPAGKRM